MEDALKHINAMISKAATADKSEDAMRFSQAACNAANAVACVENTKKFVSAS